MGTPNTVLIAAGPSLVRSLIQEILAVHGYHVLSGNDRGISPVEGHSFRDPIPLLICDADYGGDGREPRMAENLAYLRPALQVFYFKAEAGRLWLVEGRTAIGGSRVEFSPGALLQWAALAVSRALETEASSFRSR